MFAFLSRRWKWLVTLTLACVVIYGAERYYNDLTKGFGPSAIASTFPHNPEWEIAPLRPSQRQELEALFSQKFTYLSKGTQSYVLESDDHRYVVKFLKGKHLHFPSFLKMLFNVPFIGPKLEADFLRREAKRTKICRGCKLAYEEMQEESGVLYVHINRSDDLPNQLVIVDRLGREFVINPNTVPFYVQKKGVPVNTALRQLRDKGDLEAGREAIRKVFAYLVKRSKREFYDRDSNSSNNLGFFDGEVATLDVGNLSKDKQLSDPKVYTGRIIFHTACINRWIQANWPELGDEYQAQVQKLRNACPA